METRLSNILKTTKTTKFIKTILERTYKVVLGKYNFAVPTQPVLKKIAKLYLSEVSHRSLKARQNNIHRATHYGETSL